MKEYEEFLQSLKAPAKKEAIGLFPGFPTAQDIYVKLVSGDGGIEDVVKRLSLKKEYNNYIYEYNTARMARRKFDSFARCNTLIEARHPKGCLKDLKMTKRKELWQRTLNPVVAVKCVSGAICCARLTSWTGAITKK